jgi:hypothetical protein
MARPVVIRAAGDGRSARAARNGRRFLAHCLRADRRRRTRTLAIHDTDSSTSRLCWHGIELRLPAEWSVVRLEGDQATGSLLLADLHAPRLILRWARPRRAPRDLTRWAGDRLRDAVGVLLAKSSTPCPLEGFQAGTLVIEPDPPGKDVWVGRHQTTGTLIELILPVTGKRSHHIATDLLPGLKVHERSTDWSIFDLRCVVPGRFKLKSHRLHAGDLSLTFGDKREVLVVRQVGPASLLTRRRPLAEWLAAQARGWQQTHRSDTADLSPMTLRRKRRWRWAWFVPAARYLAHRVDADRDRLVIVDGTDAALVNEILCSATGGSVGPAT